MLVVAGCSSSSAPKASSWVEDDVTFTAGELTIYGTYRHLADAAPGPAALLISESGPTDRNGDNAVVGPIGNMRQLAELLSDRGVASLRYDKVGTGKTGIGPYKNRPNDVVSAVYTSGAKAAIRYLASEGRTDRSRISIYAVGEGAIHAMTLADDTTPGAPKVFALGLFQPLPGRYLDIITNRVKAANPTPETLSKWLAAVAQIRTTSVVPTDLPQGLDAIVSKGNVTAVVDADKIDPLGLAARIADGTPVLLTCSDVDSQADCPNEQPLIGALRHTALTVAELKGVSHVLRDDPTDSISNFSRQDPLSPQLVSALDGFVHR